MSVDWIDFFWFKLIFLFKIKTDCTKCCDRIKMACKSKFYVACLKSSGEWIEGSCAPWVIWWHKKKYDSYHHLIWWFSICSRIRFIQKKANVQEFMWNIPFLLRHSVARLHDIFFGTSSRYWKRCALLK